MLEDRSWGLGVGSFQSQSQFSETENRQPTTVNHQPKKIANFAEIKKL